MAFFKNEVIVVNFACTGGDSSSFLGSLSLSGFSKIIVFFYRLYIECSASFLVGSNFVSLFVFHFRRSLLTRFELYFDDFFDNELSGDPPNGFSRFESCDIGLILTITLSVFLVFCLFSTDVA